MVLIGHWLNQGSIRDSSGNNNHGTLTPGVSRGFVKTERGLAMEFDGTNTKIDLGTDMIGVGANSLSAWIKAGSFQETGSGRILDNGKFVFSVEDAIFRNRLVFTSDGNTFIASVDLSIMPDIWYHIVVTCEAGGTTNFYINSVQSGTANQNSGTPEVGITNAIIGNRDDQSRTFDGNIQDVRIYNTALSTQEVEDIYNQTKDGFHASQTKTNFFYTAPADLSTIPNLVAAYNMKAQSGGIVTDISGNSNTGTIDKCTDAKGLFDRGLKVFESGSAIIAPTALIPESGDFTLHIVLLVDDLSATPPIFGQYEPGQPGRATYRVLANGSVRLGIGNPNFSYETPPGKVLPNTWNVITFNRNGDVFTTYVNGVEAGTKTGSNIIFLQVSSKMGSSNLVMDEVRVYNECLSLADIQDFYNQVAKQVLLKEDLIGEPADGLNKVPSGWRIDSGTFSIQEDAIGKFIQNDSNGTISFPGIELINVTGNGYIKVLTGDLATDAEGTVDAATNIAFTDNVLTVTMTSGQKLREIVITHAAIV